MNLDFIRNHWRPDGSFAYGGRYWDTRTTDFDRPVPGLEDPLVSLIRSSVGLSGKDLLDIGCGTGRYSLAFSDTASSVTGVDASDAMIDAARRKAEALGVRNSLFDVVDWINGDTSILGRYGVVIAVNTPAICSFDTLRKMIECSDGDCFLVRFITYGSPIRDWIRRTVASEDAQDECDALLYAQACLWNLGIEPDIRYLHQRWVSKLPLEEAVGKYVSMARGLPGYVGSDDALVAGFIRSLADEDGVVEEISEPVTGVLHWRASVRGSVEPRS